MIKIRGYEITPEFLASRIDFAVVLQDMDAKTVDGHIETCLRLGVNTFCVNPHYLEYVRDGLAGSKVGAAVVLDYPFGAGTREIKIAAAEDMVRKGAKSLDMVIDFAAVKNRDWNRLTQELKDLVKAAQGIDTKPIIECHLLTKEEIVSVTKCCEEAEVSYIKTGSGRMAGPEWTDIKLIKEALSPQSKTNIKFSGTGPFWTTPIALGGFAAGAELIGTRAGDKIISELALYEEIFSKFEFVNASDSLC